MEEYNVTLFDLNRKNELQAVVHADECETSNLIILELMLGENKISGKSEEYLSAYRQLRDNLLDNGFGLMCKGSMINAVQSTMMGYVPKIYLVEIGKQALTKNVAGIFDYCRISEFPDTITQKRFIEKWRESLRRDNSIQKYV